MTETDKPMTRPRQTVPQERDVYAYEGTMYPVPKPLKDIDDMIDTYRKTSPQRQAEHQLPQPKKGEPTMSNNQQNQSSQQNPNAPLQTFKDGAAVIKLWQQEGKDQKIHVNASVGRLYKDKETGHWKESKSFSALDLAKLNTLMPEALMQAQVLEHNLNAQRQEQIRAHAQMQQQPSSAPAQNVPVQQTDIQPEPVQQPSSNPPLIAQTAQQVLSQQDIQLQRDATHATAQPAQSQSQQHTQEHVQSHNHEPSQ